jgi:hypothetical protein
VQPQLGRIEARATRIAAVLREERATKSRPNCDCTLRAGVLLASGFVARSFRSYGYAPHSFLARNQKSFRRDLRLFFGQPQAPQPPG